MVASNGRKEDPKMRRNSAFELRVRVVLRRRGDAGGEEDEAVSEGVFRGQAEVLWEIGELCNERNGGCSGRFLLIFFYYLWILFDKRQIGVGAYPTNIDSRENFCK